MQPLDIVLAAAREAPGDADRLLCWFINSSPPAKRHSLYERLCAALNTARLTGQLSSSFPAPSLFTADVAERTWQDLIGKLGSEAAAKEHLGPFFCPDGLHFVPQAYPGRWAPVTWNTPLSPQQVRVTLGLEGTHHLDDLIRIAQELVGAGFSRVGPKGFTEFAQAKLRIGVLPYGDGLPMVTLLYAVSDIVEGMKFGASSFFQQKVKIITVNGSRAAFSMRDMQRLINFHS